MGVALVSGASRGLGLAIARDLARSGHQVYAGVRNIDEARRIEDLSPSVRVVAMDVSSDESVRDAVEVVLSNEVRLDFVVCNAASLALGPVETFSSSELHSLFDTNVVGVARVCSRVLPTMRLNGGVIALVSSYVGQVPFPMYGAYAATKRAVEALAESLAIEVADFDISVSLFEIGGFRSEIFHHATQPESFNSESPYWDSGSRVLPWMRELAESQRPATSVAEAIREVLCGPAPGGRFTIGDDAAWWYTEEGQTQAARHPQNLCRLVGYRPPESGRAAWIADLHSRGN